MPHRALRSCPNKSDAPHVARGPTRHLPPPLSHPAFLPRPGQACGGAAAGLMTRRCVTWLGHCRPPTWRRSSNPRPLATPPRPARSRRCAHQRDSGDGPGAALERVSLRLRRMRSSWGMRRGVSWCGTLGAGHARYLGGCWLSQCAVPAWLASPRWSASIRITPCLVAFALQAMAPANAALWENFRNIDPEKEARVLQVRPVA